MKGTLKPVMLVGCLLAAGVACQKPKAIKPSKPVPAGTVLLQFTKKVSGNMELTVDGVRVPVQNSGKKYKHLAVSGLAAGKHRLVLLAPLAAFGPDQIDVDLAPGQGAFRVLFSQEFNSVLYGKPDPSPAAEGLPGVKAVLQP